MPVMLQKTYEAFLSASVPEEQAKEAAVELAGFWSRITRIEVVTTITLAIVIGVAAKVFFS